MIHCKMSFSKESGQLSKYFSIITINSFMTEAVIIKKPVHWFAQWLKDWFSQERLILQKFRKFDYCGFCCNKMSENSNTFFYRCLRFIKQVMASMTALCYLKVAFTEVVVRGCCTKYVFLKITQIPQERTSVRVFFK